MVPELRSLRGEEMGVEEESEYTVFMSIIVENTHERDLLCLHVKHTHTQQNSITLNATAAATALKSCCYVFSSIVQWAVKWLLLLVWKSVMLSGITINPAVRGWKPRRGPGITCKLNTCRLHVAGTHYRALGLHTQLSPHHYKSGRCST